MAQTWICRAADPCHFELYADNQKTYGGRVSTPLTEIRAAERPGKSNLGILLSTAKLTKAFPVEIKLGNISTSGSLSRLNSPELSNGSSPFSSSIISVTGLSATLPGYTSFSKPESAFLQLKAAPFAKKPFSISINSWMSSENSSPIVSALVSEKFFNKQLTVNASCTSGRFYYEENITNSWFLQTPWYASDSHLCSLFQLSADFRNKSGRNGIYTGLMAAIYESPFGPSTAAYRADIKVSVKRTEVYTSAFVNAYEDILTSSGKKLSPCCQFKAGIIQKKPLLIKGSELLFIKLGLNAFSRINLTETQHPFRINAGIQFSTDLTSLSLSLSSDNRMISKAPELMPDKAENTALSFQIKNTWYLGSFSPGISLSSEKKINTESVTDTGPVKYKIQLNLTNNARHKISASSSISFTTKNGQITDKKFSATLSCKLNMKNLTFIGKASKSQTM